MALNRPVTLQSYSMSKTIAISGAGGFIGSWCVKSFLEASHNVVAIVRDASNDAKVRISSRRALLTLTQNAHLRDLAKQIGKGKLTFASATLGDQKAYEEALKGCSVLVHVASPYFYTATDVKKEILEPAVNGTNTAIDAAVAQGLERVVVTSSGGAVMHFPLEEGYKLSKDDWNRWSSETVMPYFYSKRLAEEAAWEKSKENKIEITVVNPFYVLGPLLSPNINTSLTRLQAFVKGTQNPPAGYIPVVDVRDVARAHLLAATEPKAAKQRLLCAGSVVAWNYLLARLRAECPEHAETIVADNSEPMPARFGVDASPLESLGFANWTPIDQTINDSVESLKKHALL